MKLPVQGAQAAVLSCIVLMVMALSSCSRGEQRAPAPAVTGPRFELALVPGPAYRHSVGFLFIKLTMYPQVACWVETPDGRYVDTIYVTGKGARKKFWGAPSAGRPEALPVWSHARGAASLHADAVSGATPAGSVQAVSPVAGNFAPGRYVVKLEVNSSYDYNDRYTRVNSGVNGQPSLVYSAWIDMGKGEESADLVPVGTGSVDGSNGSITPGLEGLTTALQMLSSARITWHDR